MANTNRIQSIDLLRGAVMIIMALDHTRDFFHWKAFTDDPLNLATTSPALFMTRWITHFCAPVFVFLSGTSVYLQQLRKPKPELTKFLLTRGLWLLIAEFIIVNFSFTFDIYYSSVAFQVIGTIGLSMIIISALIWLPYPIILLIGAIIVFGHNAVNHPLLKPAIIPIGKNFELNYFYPFLPWTGIMILGYCLGKLYQPPTNYRNTRILLIGIITTLLFIVLRSINIYGDPQPWVKQKNTLYTIFSFLDVEKYPPSLLYTCMTLGPALILLSFLENFRNRFAEFVITYGRVPFFYYILHFYLIHLISSVLFFARGHNFERGYNNNFFFKFIIPGEGYSLQVVYLVWLAVVLALYPLCRWYGNYKRSHNYPWLSYI